MAYITHWPLPSRSSIKIACATAGHQHLIAHCQRAVRGVELRSVLLPSVFVPVKYATFLFAPPDAVYATRGNCQTIACIVIGERDASPRYQQGIDAVVNRPR